MMTAKTALKRTIRFYNFPRLLIALIVVIPLFISGCTESSAAKAETTQSPVDSPVQDVAMDSQNDPVMLELQGNLGTHDPVIIKEADTYYVFSTGGRPGRGFIPIKCSKDMVTWERCGNVFEDLPEWAPIEIPGTRGIWAPDVSFFNNRYHIYYSISTFGKNDSAIGLVTNKTLDSQSPDHEWIDHGMVLRSTRGVDDFNAIDANIAVEDENNVWICWGSFWGGIKMKKLDPETGMLSTEDTTLYNLSSRPRTGEHQTPPTEGAVEAPFLFRHGRYWYLFVSFDFCCRGANSTYNVVVGRSPKITGPYLDKEGKSMLEGGGSLVIEATTPNWRGPGHCAVFHDNGTDYLVFHAYHGQTGRSELKISTMAWENGWPRAAELP